MLDENKARQEKRKEALSQLPRFRGNVPSKNTVRGLPEVSPGEIFWIEMDNKAFIVTNVIVDGNKRKIEFKELDEMATISTGITIYEMNKSLVSKEPLFDWEDAEACGRLGAELEQWLEQNQNKFYLLYGRDIHYVSLISRAYDKKYDINILFETINNAGDLISMDFNTSPVPGESCIEIWIRTPTSKAELMYFFPYDKGLVYF